MAKFVKKPHQQTSIIKQSLDKKLSKFDLDGDKSFLLSFKHYDKTQGQTFTQWEENFMLSKAVEVLSHYCTGNMESQKGEKFTVYGEFPKRSNFYHPKHVPEDADWARIHVDGVHIVAGHVFKNIFYVVFLDHDHTFYITEKKNT